MKNKNIEALVLAIIATMASCGLGFAVYVAATTCREWFFTCIYGFMSLPVFILTIYLWMCTFSKDN